VATPISGTFKHFVIRRLGLAMFNPHIKFEMSTITCNEEMKGHAKCKNSRFELSCGSLRRNVHGSSMARWKARGWLPIDANCIFLASSHGCGTIKRNLSKSAFFDGGGSLRAQILGRRTSHAIHLWTIIEEWCVYSYNNEAGSFHTKKLCCGLFSTEVEIHLKK